MLTIDIAQGLVPKQKQKQLLAKLKPLIEHLKNVAKKQDDADDYSTINVPFDRRALHTVENLAKKYKHVDALLIIGIGGSNLGTLAVQEAILGKRWNMKENKPKIFYADTTDPRNIHDTYHLTEELLHQKKNVLINIVTKSGTTTETIANAQVFIELLAEHTKDWRTWVVITTDPDSKLWHVAKQAGLSILESPKNVSGRYSVFSAVGLFPFMILGIDGKALLKGAAVMRDACLQQQNPAALSAAHLFYHSKNRNIHDTFLFSTDFESIGKWYRQLLAESIGKEKNFQGKKIHAGITPTVSIGTIDCHSMTQLTLAGPPDKYTTFVTIEHEKNDLSIPAIQGFETLVPEITGKTVQHIRAAIIQGVMHSYQQRKLPYTHVTLPSCNEEHIGAFLQFKMMETIYLGKLMNVNPFNQPAVEEYKQETKKILKET